MTRETMDVDVVGYLAKSAKLCQRCRHPYVPHSGPTGRCSQCDECAGWVNAPESILNTDGPMTRRAAGYFAERMRQLGYSVRITRRRKGA